MSDKEVSEVLSIREQLIELIMPEEKRGGAVIATRGLFLGMISSESSFKVSTPGSKYLYDYITEIENKLAEFMGVEAKKEVRLDEIEYVATQCDRCIGMGQIKAGGVRSIKLKPCPVCHGRGNVLVEKKD